VPLLALARAAPAGESEQQFLRWFDLNRRARRHIKVLGILLPPVVTRDGKPGYLPDLPRTLELRGVDNVVAAPNGRGLRRTRGSFLERRVPDTAAAARNAAGHGRPEARRGQLAREGDAGLAAGPRGSALRSQSPTSLTPKPLVKVGRQARSFAWHPRGGSRAAPASREVLINLSWLGGQVCAPNASATARDYGGRDPLHKR